MALRALNPQEPPPPALNPFTGIRPAQLFLSTTLPPAPKSKLSLETSVPPTLLAGVGNLVAHNPVVVPAVFRSVSPLPHLDQETPLAPNPVV
ncbi:MAG: hypothetical protein K0U98_01480 [Deltaproteobacteria bacterium]|nr:hypothetical protein [Deltaproteobacteria bacterium]